MRTANWVRGIIVAAATIAVAAISGCAGFWDPLPSGGGGTNPASGVFYVLNAKTNQLAGFTFAAGASSPTAVTNSPYTLDSTPLSMALTPSGNYLYVSTLSGITYYSVNSDGSLTAGSSGQTLSSDTAFSMQVDPTGSWLIESVTGSGVLAALPLNTSTGALNGTAQTVNLPATTLKGIAITPSASSGSYVFVAMGNGGTATVAFNASNANPFGTVTKIAPKNSLGGDNAVAVDPQGRLLYVGETASLTGTQSGGLRVFTISTTAVQEISGSPFSTGGTGPSSILPQDSYVYVSNSSVSGSSSGNISGFSVTASGSTYTLTAINTVSTGSLTYALAEDSTSAYLLAVNYGGSPDLSTFTFDTTTAGKLVAGPTSSTGTDPTGALAIVAAP